MYSVNLDIILQSLTLQHLPFEERLLAVIGILGAIFIILLISGRYWKEIFRHLSHHPDADDIFHGHKSLRYALHDITFIIKLLLIVYVLLVVRSTLNQRPYVAQTYPPINSRFITASPNLTIDFTLPVDKDTLTFHTSPEVEGEWVWEDKVLGLPLYKRVIFHPKESFFPSSQVVVYMVGLKPPWYAEKSHELALEYSSPRIPKIKNISPQDKSDNVPINTIITIEYDSPINGFVDTTIDSKPRIEIEKIDTVGNTQTITLAKNLEQDQTYTLSVYQTPRSYQVATNDDLERGDTELLDTVTFKTVSTPLVSTHEPKGDAVKTDLPIKVTFDQIMDQQNVVRNFSIEPQITGEISWEGDKTFIFTPHQPLTKNTAYTLTFTQGIQSSSGGKTEEDIVLNFTTIGHVRVASFSPVPGTTGIDPVNAPMNITFDQPVEKKSAEQHISISPNINGSFRWQGDTTLIFQPANALNYSTTYTITVSPGIKTVDGLDSEETFTSRFTTKSQLFALNIPYYKQEEGFTCNVAATRMALAYRGVTLTEANIKNGLGIGNNPNNDWVPGYGVHVGPVSQFVGQYRSVAVKTNWNVSDMLREVQNGNPVIIWEYNRYSQPYGAFTLSSGVTGYNGMHSEVVRGYIGDINNPSHVLTNDPWRGQLTYDINTFNSVWSYLNNTALIIY